MKIIELIANIEIDRQSFPQLVDAQDRLEQSQQENLWKEYQEEWKGNLIAFYKGLSGSESAYIKDSINRFMDNKIEEQLSGSDTSRNRHSSGESKIKPIDDLGGPDNWPSNEDVKGK